MHLSSDRQKDDKALGYSLVGPIGRAFRAKYEDIRRRSPDLSIRTKGWGFTTRASIGVRTPVPHLHKPNVVWLEMIVSTDPYVLPLIP